MSSGAVVILVGGEGGVGEHGSVDHVGESPFERSKSFLLGRSLFDAPGGGTLVRRDVTGPE
jgi:hypothetical protein